MPSILCTTVIDKEYTVYLGSFDNSLLSGADILKTTVELKRVFPTPLSLDNQRAARYVTSDPIHAISLSISLALFHLSYACMCSRALQVAAIHGGYPEPAIAVISVSVSCCISIPLFRSTS